MFVNKETPLTTFMITFVGRKEGRNMCYVSEEL